LVFFLVGVPTRPVGLRLASRSHIRFSLPRAQTLPPFHHSAGGSRQGNAPQYNIYVIFYITYGVKFKFPHTVTYTDAWTTTKWKFRSDVIEGTIRAICIYEFTDSR
jgi:hypothetical protein